jgi:hypothetical protein
MHGHGGEQKFAAYDRKTGQAIRSRLHFPHKSVAHIFWLAFWLENLNASAAVVQYRRKGGDRIASEFRQKNTGPVGPVKESK